MQASDRVPFQGADQTLQGRPVIEADDGFEHAVAIQGSRGKIDTRPLERDRIQQMFAGEFNRAIQGWICFGGRVVKLTQVESAGAYIRLNTLRELTVWAQTASLPRR